MTRTMYDSVDPFAIPASAQMVAGYVDGIFVWSDAGWARFPAAVKVRIAISANTNDGDVGDMESGDMTPQSLVSWVRMRRQAGADPSGYLSFDRWQEARDAFAAAGEPEPHWWVALYDDVPVIPDGAVAKQYAGSALTQANFDLSEVADHWPGVDVMTAEEHAWLQNLFTQLGGGLPGMPTPGGVGEQLLSRTADLVGRPAFDPAVLAPLIAQALVADQAFLQAIAQAVAPAVVKLEGTKLSS